MDMDQRSVPGQDMYIQQPDMSIVQHIVVAGFLTYRDLREGGKKKSEHTYKE